MSHSSSFIRIKRLSLVTPALLTRISTLPIAASAAGTSASVAALWAKIAGKHMDIGFEFGGERVERVAAGA